MLAEMWDAAESPNFGYAVADSLDATFNVLSCRIRGQLFVAAAAHLPPERTAPAALPAVDATAATSSSAAAPPPLPPPASAASDAGAVVADAPSAEGAAEETATAVAAAAAAIAVPETAAVETEPALLTPPLATVVSQLKGILAEMLDTSDLNRYPQAIAGLASVSELCASVFGQLEGLQPPPLQA
ncbi:unnamed protein product [Phaeothamnion confervicola]